MGMFDYITFEMQIDSNPSPHTFQTKSFENTMSRYVVTQKGQLYSETWNYKWVDDDNAFLKGYMEKIPESYERTYLTDFHGDVIFYDDVQHEYMARFSYGRLDIITQRKGSVDNESVLHECSTIWESSSSKRNT
jgi:hypothetical protein